MSDKSVPPFLNVLVLDAKNEVLSKANVILRFGGQDGEERKVPFDEATGLYMARDIPAGPATVTVASRGKDTQSRETVVGAGENREVFLLDQKGGRTFFRGKVRVPITADPDLFGLVLDRQFRDGASEFDQLVESIGIDKIDIPDLAARAGMRLFRASGVDHGEALAEIRKNPTVEHVGIVVQMREDGISFLSSEVVVKFNGPRIEEVREVSREYGFVLQRGLVYADGTFVLEWQGNPEELLEAIEKLATRDDVEWAEPSVVVSPELDAVIPGDTLWPD